MEDHARISAEVAEGTHDEAEVLKRHGLSADEWNDATRHWMTALAEDVQRLGADARLAIEYSDSFASHQQSLKAPLDMSPERWAELEYDIERSEAPDVPLSSRQMSLADYMRLVRVFAKRMAEEPAVAVRVARRKAELASKGD